MTRAAPPTTRLLSTAFGLAMAATASVHTHGFALVAAALSVAAVAAAIQFRPATTLAVVLTVAGIALSDPSPVPAAISGTCAAAYLVLRHTTASAATTVTPPTAVGALLFASVALVATTLPVQLPWTPLAAPVIALTIYLLTVHPLAWGSGSGIGGA